MGGAGLFGKFAPRLLKLYVIYVACTADLIVHLHIKVETLIIKGSRICEFIILQQIRISESIVVRIGRRLADPVELYTVCSDAVHIKVIQIGVFIAHLHTRIAQAAEEMEFDPSRVLQLLHPLGHIQNLRRHLIAQTRLQIPYDLAALHLLEVEVKAYPRLIVAVIQGQNIVVCAVGFSGYIPFAADLTDALVILKHLHRVGFVVAAEKSQSVDSPICGDVQLLRVEDLEVIHMAAPRGGVKLGVCDIKVNTLGGVDGECDCLDQAIHISVAVAAGNTQRSILQNRCVFRHDGIVGAGFLGGILREDTELSVSKQLKVAAAVQASLRLRQIDDRAGHTILRTVGGLILIPGAVAEGDNGAIGQNHLQINAGGIQGG